MLKAYEGEDNTCFPSCNTIGKLIGIYRSHINEFIHEMIDVGIIEMIDKGNAERSATYRILIYSRTNTPKPKNK